MGTSGDLWEVLREAGYEPTEETRRRARERLESARVGADDRVECQERMQEIMTRPS
jgi:hypothetical protein